MKPKQSMEGGKRLATMKQATMFLAGVWMSMPLLRVGELVHSNRSFVISTVCLCHLSCEMVSLKGTIYPTAGAIYKGWNFTSKGSL